MSSKQQLLTDQDPHPLHRKKYATFEFDLTKDAKTFQTYGLKEELIGLFKLSISNIFGMTFRMLAPIVSVIMCGHLGQLALNAVTLSNSIVAITNLSISAGFSAAIDTIFSQTYGQLSRRKKMGYLLQRILLLISLVIFLLISIIINMESILLAFHQNPTVSKMSARYLQLYAPALFFEVIFNVLTRFLNSQNIYYPAAVIGCLGLVFNVTGQYIVLHVLKINYLASAIWHSITIFLMLILLILQMLISKNYVETWEGFSLGHIFRNWLPFLKLAIDSFFCNLFLNLFLESFTLIAGTFGVVSLGAYGIAFQIFFSSYLIPMGVLIAMTVRIGQGLGAAQVESARFSFRVGAVVSLSIALILSVSIATMRDVLHPIFTTDRAISQVGSLLNPYAGLFSTCITIYFIPLSVLRATGRLKIAAALSFVGFFVVGEASGLLLSLLANLKLIGLWIGLCIAMLCTGLLYFLVIGLMNWGNYTELGSNYDPDGEWSSSQGDVNFNYCMLLRISTVVCVTLILFVSIGIAIFVPSLCLPDKEMVFYNYTRNYSFLIFCNLTINS